MMNHTGEEKTVISLYRLIEDMQCHQAPEEAILAAIHDTFTVVKTKDIDVLILLDGDVYEHNNHPLGE